MSLDVRSEKIPRLPGYAVQKIMNVRQNALR